MSAPASTTAATAAPFSSASLYVGDLAADVTEATLFEAFNAIGPVASVRVCRDVATRRSLGYAYVNYHRSEDADKAMARLNFQDINNRPVRIMWSHRDPSLRRSGLGNIFIKNLAKTIDHRALYDTFAIFGPILSCKVAMNSKGDALGYGFVHYESEEAATAAIEKVDGKVIAEQKVSVAAFKPKKERVGESKTSFTNLYVKNLPADITKPGLEELFAKHGTVTSAMLAVDAEGKSRGFGFVNMDTQAEAQAAVEALNELEISGNKLYVGRAQKKEEREKELRERFEKIRQERANKYQGINLYVKNLSDDMDEARLREEFGKFGSVANCRIMKDATTGKSRGFGFVSYAAHEDGTKAVTALNGQLLDGKPLFVAIAQRKEARRAEIEARRAQNMQNPHMFATPPMYYPGPARGFMYPGMQGPRGWVPMPGQPMMPNMRPQPGMYPYGAMPYPGRNGPAGPGFAGPQGARGGARAGRGGRGGAQGGAPAPAGAGPATAAAVVAAGAAAPAVQYTQNVRNQNRAAEAQPQAQAAAAVQPEAVAAKTQSMVSLIAAAPDKQKKQIIGEQLFMRIRVTEPALAGKITGMLLEMDNGELIALLESPAALDDKVAEAKEVLQNHPPAAAASE